MTGQALILVDIQNDYFEAGLWPVAKMQEVAENAARLLGRARTAGDLVVHIRHEMASDQAPFFRPGSAGADIHPTVAPAEGEAVITKARPNSFLGTDLLERLQAAGIGAVTICGAMSQMCIDATARAAADHGFAVTVVEDACGAKEAAFGGVELSADQVHAAFMAPLAMSYAKVLRTGELLEG
ncbi:cysteine hydrolase family protein [Pseudodonghicola flavimaris]|uniref:Cysteine hydrolase family protein n=1 Tax=Pseudodonghicola flavimaris TaxID=3050036 RepID=A0ABT7EYF4_9RHOB|nr:cysteine hydrolase family protein [Pseudodonghicola flavimaris]MDK3017380.1 cysteine hydrolase family protein [Pseudodonghicola flavimaris]